MKTQFLLQHGHDHCTKHIFNLIILTKTDQIEVYVKEIVATCCNEEAIMKNLYQQEVVFKHGGNVFVTGW